MMNSVVDSRLHLSGAARNMLLSKTRDGQPFQQQDSGEVLASLDTQQPNWVTFKKDMGAYRLQQNNTYQGTGAATEAVDDLNAGVSKTTAANQRTGKAPIHTINALPSRTSITTNNLSLASAATQQQQQL